MPWTGDGAGDAVYELRSGHLEPVQVSPAAPFGDGFFLGLDRFQSWQTADGGLDTALPINEASTSSAGWPQRVWSWRLNHRRLTPTPVGVVCMHDGAASPKDPASYHGCEP